MRRALVIGGGPGGLCAALAIRRAGYVPLVCEAAPELRAVGSGLTLWPNAMQALEQLGAGEAIREVASPMRGIAMKRHTGATMFAVASESIGWSAALHHAELQAALAAAVGRHAIRPGLRCIAVTQHRTSVTAHFASGESLSGAFLIGADGLHSCVREAIAGSDALRWAGYRVWRGVVPYELPDDIGTTTLGRGAQFGSFPMSRGRTYWFASLDHGEQATPLHDPRPMLAARLADWHAPIGALIRATDPAAIVATGVYDRRPIAQWTHGRATLLGDAAHPAVPTLGQGACQAIEDAAALAECLIAEPAIPAALIRYQQHRIKRANDIVRASWRIGKTGQWRNRVACRLRDWLLAATPHSLRMKQLNDMFHYSPLSEER